MQNAHNCRLIWPLAAIVSGFIYGPIARYGGSLGKPVNSPAAALALVFIYAVAALVGLAAWLVPSAQNALTGLIGQVLRRPERSVCVTYFIGFAMMNSIFVYGVFAVMLTHEIRFYTIGALIVAAIVVVALIRSVGSRVAGSETPS